MENMNLKRWLDRESKIFYCRSVELTSIKLIEYVTQLFRQRLNTFDYYYFCGYYASHICDARRSYVVMTDTKPGLIGPLYTFSPKKAVIVSDAYDEADFHYFRKAKEPIPKGTELEVSVWFQNLYECYYSVKYKGHKYDIKTECVEFIEESNNS